MGCWPTAHVTSKALRERFRRTKLYGPVVAGLGVLAGSACDDGRGATAHHERVLEGSEPIIFGDPSGREHDAVVVLTTFANGQRRSLCTATLVAPNLIVSARHCVSDTDASTACSDDGKPVTGATIKADRRPEDLVVFVGRDGVALDTDVESNGTVRGAHVVVDSSTTICNHDIAFVVLERKLDAPLAPVRLAKPMLDEPILAVGWGIDETGALPKSREVRGDLFIAGIGPGLYPGHARYGYGDTEFLVGESACSGDSGSPAFSPSGAVIGVAARAGNGEARDPSNQASRCMGDKAHVVYTWLGGHEPLVVRAFQEAGEPMWIEGQPDPRARPEALPPPARETGAPRTSAPEEHVAAVVPGEPETAALGGCSMPPEPKRGAVEYAAGFVALLTTLAGLQRRLWRRRAADDGDERSVRPWS